MTPSRAARLLSMVSDTSDPGRLANALLLTPSIGNAFKNGHAHVYISGGKRWDDLDENAGKNDLEAKVSISNPLPHIATSIYLLTSTSFLK